MSENNGGLLCALGGWGLAIVAGFLAAVLLMVLGDWRLIQAIFGGIVIAILVGAFLSWVVCRPLPGANEIPKTNVSTNPTPSTQDVAKAAADEAKAGTVVAGGAAAAGAAAAGAAAASDAGTDDSDGAAADAAASADAAGSADDTVGSSSIIKPSTPLAGTDELASRKGSWTYGADDAADGGDDAADDNGSKAKSVLAAVESSDTLDESEVDDSASIEAELPAADATSPAPNAKNDAGEDYDKDGVVEGENEGTKPEALDGPRGGTADNLKEIKGIGPKLEILCNELGFYHFDQIANWTADEVAWVNANLKGFKGRVSRDNWVEQAKILASGGETEFSKRVEDGDVY